MGEATTSSRYPIGIQTFEKIREGGYLYVDKTAFVHELAHGSGSTYFLSRPRRFGKSLLLSTMQAYFEGRRELFDGLAISELETAWESHPVIRIDLSTVKTEDQGQLEELLNYTLSEQEALWGRNADARTPGSRLMALIRAAYEQTGKTVVVLVDEYDAPLLNVAHDPEKLHAFRLAMREFFAPLKACDEYLRFVFLTGITKFSQLSIFSELNNLKNISLDHRFAAICGITEEELTGQMSSDVDALAATLGIHRNDALACLKANYDGYHFCSPSPDIYNPFSLLSALDSGQLDAYWFGSGTPTVLVNLLQKNGWEIGDLEDREADAEEFDVPAEGMQTPLPMLYQSGYLTIKSRDPFTGAYTLGIPNAEVARGLSRALVRHAAPQALGEVGGLVRTISRSLRSDDMEDALQATKAFMAGMPYHLGSHSERGFQTTFWLIFTLLGAQIDTEVRTATGRVDAVVKMPGSIYVMEFKYNKSAQEALAQIDSKGYLLPYKADGRKLYKVGVNFSEASQTLEDWVIEEDMRLTEQPPVDRY